MSALVMTGNLVNVLGDCANGLSGSSVVDSNDNCLRKDAESDSYSCQ